MFLNSGVSLISLIGYRRLKLAVRFAMIGSSLTGIFSIIAYVIRKMRLRRGRRSRDLLLLLLEMKGGRRLFKLNVG